MFFVIALAAVLVATLVTVLVLARRVERTDPGIEGFAEFRDALRPAILRLDASTSATAQRRRSIQHP